MGVARSGRFVLNVVGGVRLSSMVRLSFQGCSELSEFVMSVGIRLMPFLARDFGLAAHFDPSLLALLLENGQYVHETLNILK